MREPEKLERQLARTAPARGTPSMTDSEAEAMREAERENAGPMERINPTASSDVRRALDPDNAVPVAAPVTIRRSMSEKMRRFADAVSTEIPGETLDERRERLDKLRNELWPGDGCECHGTGLITKTGEYRRRDGRSVSGVTWVEPCSCPYGLSRRAHADSRDDDGGLEDVF